MQTRATAVAVFLVSLSTLAYEIILLRVFSVTLGYHFAFMIISIAMLGIGVSGTFLYMFNSLKQRRLIPLYCLLTGMGIILSYTITNTIPLEPARLLWDSIQLFYIPVYYLLLCLPFFTFGLAVSTALSLNTRTGIIYGADLLGAAAGVLFSIVTLKYLSPEKAILLSTLPALGATTIWGRKRLNLITMAVIGTVVILLDTSAHLFRPRISEYKPLSIALKYPGAEHIKTLYSSYSQIDIVKTPAARFAPGLSLYYTAPLPEQIGLAIDGGEIVTVTIPRSLADLTFIEYLPASLPYVLLKNNLQDVLLIDPAGGLDVLIAKYYSAKNIYRVESNPLLVKAVRQITADSRFNPYREQTWTGSARMWLQNKNKSFDIINISATATTVSGGFGFSEDYRFTEEAFTEYLSYLKQDGILSITVFILPPPRMEFRIINTLYEVFKKHNMYSPQKNIAIIRTLNTITILAKKHPFTDEELKKMEEFASSRGFDMLYHPDIDKDTVETFIKMPSNQYINAFLALLDQDKRNDFIENYLFDINPVEDDRPFFRYYLKLSRIKEIYQKMGQKWQYFIEEGYLLPVVFLQVLLISVVIIVFPLCRKHTGQFRGKDLTRLLYFAILGLGYMFVEVSLFQRLIQALDNPAYAVGTVIFSMLLSSSAGSFCTDRNSMFQRPELLLVIFIILLIYSITLSVFIKALSLYPLHIRILAGVLFVMPAGFLLGIPFPLGLKALSRTSSDFIPWAWAVNGSLSVLAPVLCVMIALTVGFSMVVLITACLYLCGYFLLKYRF